MFNPHNYYAQKNANHHFYSENKVKNNKLMSAYYGELGNSHRENYYQIVGINEEKGCYSGCQVELDVNNLAVSM